MDENKVIEVDRMCSIHESYMKALEAYIDVKGDQHMYWCEEDEKMELLRKNAEIALDNYQKALHRLYFDGMQSIEKRQRESVCKISKIFKRFKKGGT